MDVVNPSILIVVRVKIVLCDKLLNLAVRKYSSRGGAFALWSWILPLAARTRAKWCLKLISTAIKLWRNNS